MGFDRVARIYRGLEWIVYGGDLQRARLAHLDVAGEPAVLLLGDGDGRFLEALLREAPGAEVDVVEASAGMIELARRRVPNGAEIVFHQIEIAEFVPCKPYDLVVSHFFLDCFDRVQIERIVNALTVCIREGGSWLISDFQIPAGGVLKRSRARFLLWVMYRFFRAATGIAARELVDPDPILRAAGLGLASRVESNLGFLRADRWSR